MGRITRDKVKELMRGGANPVRLCGPPRALWFLFCEKWGVIAGILAKELYDATYIL